MPGKTTGQLCEARTIHCWTKHIMNGDTEKISGGEIYNCSSNKHKWGCLSEKWVERVSHAKTHIKKENKKTRGKKKEHDTRHTGEFAMNRASFLITSVGKKWKSRAVPRWAETRVDRTLWCDETSPLSFYTTFGAGYVLRVFPVTGMPCTAVVALSAVSARWSNVLLLAIYFTVGVNKGLYLNTETVSQCYCTLRWVWSRDQGIPR